METSNAYGYLLNISYMKHLLMKRVKYFMQLTISVICALAQFKSTDIYENLGDERILLCLIRYYISIDRYI